MLDFFNLPNPSSRTKAASFNYLSTTPRKHIFSGDITPLFLTSIFDGSEWSALHSGRFSPRRKSPQSTSRRCGVEKNHLPLPGVEPRSSSLSLHRLAVSTPRKRQIKKKVHRITSKKTMIFIVSVLPLWTSG
jgi:hypothetical protein